MGKLIVIEGLDGSGKKTQSKLLKSRLIKENHHLFVIDFPQYQKESSYFVREYLSGHYGLHADDVSCKQASLFYALDRYHYFKTNPEAKEALENDDTLLIADRYTTSNILFQAAKSKTEEELYELVDWICDTEYNLLQIPKPDLVLMPFVEIEHNIALLEKRNIASNAKENNMSTDIHETDYDYLRHVSKCGELVSKYLGFEVVDCMDEEGNLKSIESIHEDMYERVNKLILKK